MYANFHYALLRIKKALGIFRELITTTKTIGIFRVQKFIYHIYITIICDACEVFVVSSSNSGHFQNYFTSILITKVVIVLLKIPSQLKCIASLPCDVLRQKTEVVNH